MIWETMQAPFAIVCVAFIVAITVYANMRYVFKERRKQKLDAYNYDREMERIKNPKLIEQDREENG